MAELGELYWTLAVEDSVSKELKTIQDALKGTNNLLVNLSDTFEKGFNTSQLDSIGRSSAEMASQMKSLEQLWNKLSFEDKFNGDAYSADAQKIVDSYRRIMESAKEKGKTLQGIIKEEITAQEKLIKEQEKAQAIASRERVTSRKADMVAALKEQERATQEAEKQRAKRVEILRVLRQEETTITAIRQKLALMTQIQDKSKLDSKQFENARKEIERLNGVLGQYQSVSRTAINANNQFATSAGNVAHESKKQNLVVAELMTTLRNFAGFYFARDAVKQLAEVTGQFELQLVSLKAITQNADEATRVFSQFQTLAVKSPFQFSEIVAGAKQLAAFQVPLKDLYSTTKVITDLSAGLGVDMGRIILAYGQVQAAAVLRGAELRQFTEAGIPLVQLLADKFTILEGRVVSTGEVFDKISTRMVPFEMIKEIFTDLTSEGGMFFNMQEKQADTLYGKISNLKDAYQIMLNEVGSANSELLKGAVEIPMELMNNWREVGQALLVVASSFTTLKIIMAAVKLSDAIVLYGNLRKAILATAAAQKVLNVAMMTSPYAIALAALAALGTSMYFAYQNANRLKNELNELSVEGVSAADSSIESFDKLVKKLRESTEGSQNFRDAIRAINTQYGEYLPNILTESNALSELTIQYDKVTEAIYNKVKAQTYEKGLASIQEDYGKDQQDAIEALMKNLTSNNIPKEKAKDILRLFREELEKQTEDYNPYELFNKVYQGYLGTTQKYFSDTEQMLLDFMKYGDVEMAIFDSEFFAGIPKGAEALFKLSRSISGMSVATKEWGDYADVAFKKSTFSTEAEAIAVEKVEKQYTLLSDKIKNSKYTQDQLTAAIDQLDDWKIRQLIKAYEEIGRPDKVAALKKQQVELSGIQDGWREIAKEISKTNSTAGSLKPLQDETFFTYADRLKKSYNDLKNQKKMLTETSIIDPKELERMNTIILLTETIAKALGFQINSEKELNKEKKTKKDQYEEELTLIKKVYSDYKELRQLMGDEAAQKKIKELYKGLLPEIDMAFSPEQFISSLEKMSKKFSGIKAQKAVIGVEIDINKEKLDNIQKDIKTALDKAAKEVERHKEQFDIYKNLIAKGFEEGRAQTLAFGVEFKIQEGGYDIGQYLANQLAKSLDITIPGLSLDFSVDTSFIDQIGEKYKDLNDTQKKQVEELEKFRVEQQKNAFMQYADLVMKETPEGMGLQFDISNVFAKYKEELIKLQDSARQAMGSEQYKKGKAPGASAEDKAEAERVDRNIKLAQDANSKIALDKSKKLGGVYLQEKMEIAGLGEIYKNMSSASAASIESMLKVIRKSTDELLAGTQMRLSEMGLDEFAKMFQGVFNAENLTLYTEELDKVIAGLTTMPTDPLDKTTPTPEQIQKVLQFATAQRSAALSTQRTSAELKSIKVDNVLKAYKSLGESVKKVIDSVEGLGEAFGVEFNDISKAAISLASTIVGETTDIIDTIATTSKASAKGIESTSEMASQSIQSVEQASVILAIIGAAIKIATAIADLVGSSTKKKNENIIKNAESQVKRLENAYNDLGRAIDDAFGEGKFDLQARQITNLQAQQQALAKQLQTEGEKGGLSTEEADEVRRKIVELGQQQEDIINGIRESIIGTSQDLADTLGNAIIDAFLSGEDAAAAWSKSVDTIIADMVRKMIIAKLVAGEVDKIVKGFFDKIITPPQEYNQEAYEKALADAQSRAIKEGTLSYADRAFNSTKFKRFNEDFEKKYMEKLGKGGFVDIDKIIEESNKLGDDLKEFGAGIAPAIDAALEGIKDLTAIEGEGTAEGIKSITEDTANRLAGYMNSMRAEMIVQSGYLVSMMGSLNLISITANAQLTVLNSQLAHLNAMRIILDSVYDPAKRALRVN